MKNSSCSGTPDLILVKRFTKRSFIGLLIALALMVLMAGCATTYSINPDLIKNFQEPKVSADKTGVYVIRGANFCGGGRGLWLAVNDAVIADLPNSSHTFLEMDAGLNTLHFVQAKTGFGYLAIDNKPGEILYVRINYGAQDISEISEFIGKDLGQTMVMQTDNVPPLKEKRTNDAYDDLLINPGHLDYPIMVESSEKLTADEEHALVRFYRSDKLITSWPFDIWNQNGYIGSTKGGTYFTVKLKPGRHVFIARSERYSVLDAQLEANKEYAVELSVGMGWAQAHIKLLPIDLSTDKGKRQVQEWMKNLKATRVNPEVIQSDAVAKRIEMGFNYLEDVRKGIDNNKVPKRSLSATFGK